ncbi:hypothetical protein AVEN_221935-1 [Araneus ventricosus]|uniref:Uncharacterized protein n=1 Tax=Araneus ventricosus TaxID=182803 RepID=A0A4Y2F670_ARAVE|nr:hypothetical protein AVEN_221935-1 [Araneus ventricosus]
MGRILSHEEKEINEWLNSDADYPGYQILNDDEIVDEIQDEKEIEENENECSENEQVHRGRGGLMVRSRVWGRRVPGSKNDYTEAPLCMGPAER